MALIIEVVKEKLSHRPVYFLLQNFPLLQALVPSLAGAEDVDLRSKLLYFGDPFGHGGLCFNHGL